MMPQSALIILIIVVAVATITFLIALYHGLTTSLQPRKQQALRQSNESTLPLTEKAAAPASAQKPAASGAIIPAPSALSTTSLLVHISPPPPPPLRVSPKRSPTPEAESPPPLPEDTTRAEGRRQRDSTIPRAESPPPLPKHLHTYTIEPESSRLAPLRREPNPLRTDGKGIKRERDSMHDIIDLYTYASESRRKPKLPPVPKSAPATVMTFAQAESKWAYFGAKRAAEAEFHVV
ncbi:hypothetical protein ABEF95_005432 [Exophiala dermatitidis]